MTSVIKDSGPGAEVKQYWRGAMLTEIRSFHMRSSRLYILNASNGNINFNKLYYTKAAISNVHAEVAVVRR
jgi:hypothetical protein